MKRMKLPIEYATVLLQISRGAEEEFECLADNLRISHAQLAHIVQELHHKGLIISTNASTGLWIRLSSKGKKAMHMLHREAPLALPAMA